MADLGAVVANNVRAERARRHWRQEDLAARLGWSRGSIGHLESGRRRPAVSDLPPLCRAFDISLLELLRGADQADLDALRI
jgi:transcriptional regulator with XRE-family HTH domain